LLSRPGSSGAYEQVLGDEAGQQETALTDQRRSWIDPTSIRASNIQGKYFNKIADELQHHRKSQVTEQAITLSSPTGRETLVRPI
jgi:hypothetical protein